MAFGKKLTQLPEKTSSVVDADQLLVTDSADGLSKRITGDKLPEDPSAKWLDPVRVRTTANVDLAGGGLAAGTEHDGVVLAEGDRVLVMVQDDAIEVGIYLAPASGAAARSSDMPAGAFASMMTVSVDQGSTPYKDTTWICKTDRGSDVVGTDELEFGPLGGSGSVPTHAASHVSGGGDPIAGCDLACGETPTNFTPTSATLGGMVQGIDNKLGELGAQSVTADPDGKLEHASANEVGVVEVLEVDKAAGNYIAKSTDVTETSAPGSANKLREWKVGGTPKLSIASSGSATIHNAGTPAAPALEIDRGAGGKLGLHAPADNQLALAANDESLIVDNDGGTPSLRGDVTETWALGELAFAYAQVYSAQLSLVTGGVIAMAITPTALTYSGASLTIAGSDPGVGGTAKPITVQAGKGGDTDGGGSAKAGAAVSLVGGAGGAGDATWAGGSGGKISIGGGAGGTDNGGGGDAGGDVLIRGGAGTGAGADGTVVIGDTQTSAITLGASGVTTTHPGRLVVKEQVRLGESGDSGVLEMHVVSGAIGQTASTGKLYTATDAGLVELVFGTPATAGFFLTENQMLRTRRPSRQLGSGSAAFTINEDDERRIVETLTTSPGQACTVDAGRDGQVTTLVVRGNGGSVAFSAGSGVTLVPPKGKTTTTEVCGASEGVVVSLLYIESTVVQLAGGLA